MIYPHARAVSPAVAEPPPPIHALRAARPHLPVQKLFCLVDGSVFDLHCR